MATQMSVCLPMLFQTLIGADQQGDAEQECAGVRDRLGNAESCEPGNGVPDQNGRDEEQPLACACNKHGGNCPPDVLEEHVGEDDDPAERERHAVPAEHLCADLQQGGIVVAEYADKLRGEYDCHHSECNAVRSAHRTGKSDGLAESVEFPCPEIEPANRLEPLPESYQQR